MSATMCTRLHIICTEVGQESGADPGGWITTTAVRAPDRLVKADMTATGGVRLRLGDADLPHRKEILSGQQEISC
jgi:hypothetical protein